MDEPKSGAPQSADSASDDGVTKIPVNVNGSVVNSESAADSAAVDPDAIAPPAPGQVVNADAADNATEDESVESSEAADTESAPEPETPAEPTEPTPADNQPPPTVINPGDSEAAPATDEADSEAEPAGEEIASAASAPPEPSITPAGLPISPEPQAPVVPQPPTGADIPSAPPPGVVTSNRGGKGRWIKVLLLLLIIALLAVGGYFAYQKNHKTNKPAAPAVSKDVPLLRIGIKQADFGGIFPDISDNDYSVTVNSQMFEGLVRYENRSKIVPDLASTWTNPDNNTWLFTIKKGVKFHDGHTLTPNDVKYSLETMMASTSDFAKAFADTIASVQLVGDNQVKLTTKTPDPTLLNKLTLLFVIDASAPKGGEPSLAGTGPYEIKPGTKPSDDSVQLVAFDGYHGGRPTTRALSFSNITDNDTLIKDFNAGQYDIAGTVSPGTSDQAENATLLHISEADTSYLGFNTVRQSPVQNKLVREAIRYAVNAAAIGKANGQDLTPVSQVVPPTIPGYDPAITPYKQNIAKAKQLLTQAGYPNGVTLTLSVSSVNSKEAAEISGELKQAGITVKLDQHSDFDEFINYFSAGKAQMYVVDYADDTLDAANIYQTILPAVSYNNPKVNDLLTQANATLNPATRLKLLQQVAVLVDQDVPVVPIGTTADTWIMNKQYDIQQDSMSGYLPVYFYTVKLK